MGYTLNCASRGAVTVTILQAGTERPDPARLQHDLERMGVDPRVYEDDPCCPPDKSEDAELGYTTRKAIHLHN